MSASFFHTGPHTYADYDLPDDEDDEAESEEDIGAYYETDLDDEPNICGPLWSPQPRD